MSLHTPSSTRSILRSIALAAIPVGTSKVASTLFGLRIASPAVVLLTTISLLPAKHSLPPSPSPITSVVVQSLVPRKSLILSLLSLIAFSFLVDGLAYVAYAVLNGVWRPGTGTELTALLGLIAYSALAALGAYKDVNDIDIWSCKHLKLAFSLVLALDIAQVVLVLVYLNTHPGHICDSSKLSACIPDVLHFLTPLIRAVLVLALFFAFLSPRIAYLPIDAQTETAQTEGAPLVGQSTILLQDDGNEAVSGGEGTKYGTFSTHGQPQFSAVTARSGSGSILVILRRLVLYVYPAKALLSCITLLHVLTRVITPFVPLSLGAAFNAFLPSSSAPIPTPLGTSPYPYILAFALLHFLISLGGIPNLTNALVSRLGAHADDALSSQYIDHVLGLALGSSKAKVPEDSDVTTAFAITKTLHAVSVVSAAMDDSLIGVVVLGILFGWEFGFAILIALGIFGYLVCLTSRPGVPSTCPSKTSASTFVQALIGSGALLLGSLYIAKGVTQGVWSAGAWATWVWYWGVLFLPFTWAPSLRIATSDVRSIFKVLDKPGGVVGGKRTIDGAGGIEIKLDNVCLTHPYTDTQEPVPALMDVSFIFPANSVTAVVNATGSTRSSLLMALYRLYDIDSGSIYLNGVPIHSLSLTSLRSLVAVVPDVCSASRAKALSRAFGKDAKVVLIEGPLERAFIGGRTVLWEVGSNELDGVDGVDQILVLKDGKPVESGPFRELVQMNGLFASMWAIHVGTGVPVPGSSSAMASGATEGYDVSIIDLQPVGQTAETSVFVSHSPRTVATSVHALPTSIREPSIKPSASTHTESVAPSVPTKDIPSTVFSSVAGQPQPTSFPVSSDAAVALAFPASSPPAQIVFPKTDDSRSIASSSQAHVRLPTSITFETTATPPRVSTPDPTGASSSSPTPDAEGKRKRISSQNFQRLARRISLSTPKKGPGIQGIPGIAGIAGVLRRDASVKSDKNNGENGARQSTDGAGGGLSAPETARSSGELSAERTEKDKEREEKKRKRKSFMEVVGAKRGDSGAVTTPPATDTEPQGEA